MFKFNILWNEKTPKGDLITASLGTCNLSLDGKTIWNSVSAVWVDFLEHLTSSWDAIFMDGSLKADASEIDRIEYELNHDLSRGIKSGVVPSVLIYRYGNDFEILIGQRKQKITYSDVSKFLNLLGNTISLRISSHQDLRAKKVIEKWNKRKKHNNGITLNTN
jgi:hypothetical protein